MSLRWWVVTHLFLSFVICNCDRINLSVAIMPMSATMGWDTTTSGVVQACFFVGYMVTQIPAGRLADRVGGRRCLGAAVAAWSIFTIATPVAARSSLPALYVVRALLGLAEGFAMPAVNAVIATWVPKQETARALSLVYSGMYGGSIVGLVVSPLLLARFDWPMLFYFFGFMGVVWAALFLLTTSDTPETAASISADELAYIQANAPASSVDYSLLAAKEEECTDAAADVGRGGQPTLAHIFSRRCVWAICIAHFCVTWGYFVLLTWLPSFLHMKYQVDVAHSSLYATAPWVTMFIAANLSGQFADFLLASGVRKVVVRKLMQSVAFLGPALFLGVLAKAETVSEAMIYVASALGLASLSNSGVYSNHQDIGPRCAGTLLGISNTFASIPGIVGVSITGVLLDRTANDWASVFNLAIAFYIIGFFVFNAFATTDIQWA